MANTRKEKPANPWLSLPKAAAMLGRHRQTVMQMAIRGEIGSQVVGDRLFVSRTDIEARAAERQATAA